MAKHYLSKEGHEKLEQELESLKNTELPKVIERIAVAKELGDLSENAEYQDAKEQQGFIAGRIAEIENILKNAELISDNKNSDVIMVGSTIDIDCDHGKFTYTITGPTEADPAKGMISNESPLGRAFIGRRVGEQVTVNIPKGDMKCVIKKIS